MLSADGWITAQLVVVFVTFAVRATNLVSYGALTSKRQC